MKFSLVKHKGNVANFTHAEGSKRPVGSLFLHTINLDEKYM